MTESEFIVYRKRMEKDVAKLQLQSFKKGLAIGSIISLIITSLTWALVIWI